MGAIFVGHAACGEEGLRLIQRPPETKMDLGDLGFPRIVPELFCA